MFHIYLIPFKDFLLSTLGQSLQFLPWLKKPPTVWQLPAPYAPSFDFNKNGFFLNIWEFSVVFMTLNILFHLARKFSSPIFVQLTLTHPSHHSFSATLFSYSFSNHVSGIMVSAEDAMIGSNRNSPSPYRSQMC